MTTDGLLVHNRARKTANVTKETRPMATTEPLEYASLSQPPLNASFLGVVKDTAQHYVTGFSTTEYFAESGFAYAVNIHPEICPSGPYCWNHQPILESLRHVGIVGSRHHFCRGIWNARISRGNRGSSATRVRRCCGIYGRSRTPACRRLQ